MINVKKAKNISHKRIGGKYIFGIFKNMNLNIKDFLAIEDVLLQDWSNEVIGADFSIKGGHNKIVYFFNKNKHIEFRVGYNKSHELYNWYYIIISD